MLNEIGEYVDSHHIILLLIHTLVKYKNMSGLIVTGFSSTVKVETLASHYGLDVVRVKIGFKDICKVMLKENVLVGGEESGGIAVGSHIPERDGIWMGMILFQMMVETGKTLSQLIDEVYQITGKFAFKRQDIHLTKEKRNRIAENCRKGMYSSFGGYKVERVEDLDGFKYFFNDHEWYMIRPSGTEPVLRTYAESSTTEGAAAILEAGYNTILGE
jgi:phosphomannomutase